MVVCNVPLVWMSCRRAWRDVKISCPFSHTSSATLPQKQSFIGKPAHDTASCSQHPFWRHPVLHQMETWAPAIKACNLQPVPNIPLGESLKHKCVYVVSFTFLRLFNPKLKSYWCTWKNSEVARRVKWQLASWLDSSEKCLFISIIKKKKKKMLHHICVSS